MLKLLHELSQFKQFASFKMWISSLENKNETCANAGLKNRQSVLSCPQCVFKGLVGSVAKKSEQTMVPEEQGSMALELMLPLC